MMQSITNVKISSVSSIKLLEQSKIVMSYDPSRNLLILNLITGPRTQTSTCKKLTQFSTIIKPEEIWRKHYVDILKDLPRKF